MELEEAQQTAPPPPNISAMRNSYITMFNHILDNSININCICKTTTKQHSKDTRQPINDFMDDDDEDDDRNENDIEMRADVDAAEAQLTQLDLLSESTNDPENSDIKILPQRQHKKVCDLGCFENLRYVHNLLKRCFNNDFELDECIKLFEVKWAELKFLNKDPRSCDYFGSTIFHYAASDNNFELLRCVIGKYPAGALCLDSKGTLECI